MARAAATEDELAESGCVQIGLRALSSVCYMAKLAAFTPENCLVFMLHRSNLEYLEPVPAALLLETRRASKSLLRQNGST
jgi:hypothetical protein